MVAVTKTSLKFEKECIYNHDHLLNRASRSIRRSQPKYSNQCGVPETVKSEVLMGTTCNTNDNEKTSLGAEFDGESASKHSARRRGPNADENVDSPLKKTSQRAYTVERK